MFTNMAKLHEELTIDQKIILKHALEDYENKLRRFASSSLLSDDKYWEKLLIDFQKVKRMLALVGAIV